MIDRGQEDPKDFNDLLSLKPTAANFEESVEFYKNNKMKELIGTKFEKIALDRIEWARSKLGF